MSNENELLAPCPFCGAKPCAVPQNTSFVRKDKKGFTVRIWCENCDVLGPERDDDASAIAAWNRRPILSDEAVERACPAVCEGTSFGVTWDHLLWCIRNEEDPLKRLIFEQKRDRVRSIAREALTAAFSPPPEPAPSYPVPVEAPNAGLIRVRNETGRFTEFINEDVPTVVRDIHPGVDVLLDLDTRKVVGFRVYDLTDFDALAEAWCRLAGKAIDALDAIESWDADGFDRYEVVAPIAEFAGKAVAEIRAAYPKQEPALPAAPAHMEVGE